MWDIWPRESCAVLRQYLAEHCTEFTHQGRAVQADDTEDWIHSQVRFLPYACSLGVLEHPHSMMA